MNNYYNSMLYCYFPATIAGRRKGKVILEVVTDDQIVTPAGRFHLADRV